MTEAQDTTTTEAEASTLDDRAAAWLNETADAPEPASADAGEAAAPPATADAGADSGTPAAEKTPAEARAERLAALEQKAAADAEARQRKAAQRERETEAETWRRRALEAEKRAEGLVDLRGIDADRFLELAHAAGMTPEHLGEWVRTATEGPEHAARRAITPEVEALKKLVQAQDEKINSLLRRDEMSARQREDAEAVSHLLDMTKGSSDAPLAAAYLEKRGAEKFLEFVASKTTHLPDGSGLQAVLDIVETELEQDAAVFSTTKPAPSTRSAAAKADTISNRHASERAEVTVPDNWEDLTIDERAEWLSRS